MIYGIGIDILKIDRFERVLERWGDHLRKRVFTPHELSICHKKTRPGRHLALRFAAKEAFLKALGIGMFQGVAWKEIEILNDPLGRPQMRVMGKAEKICQEKGIKEIFVSISHEKEYGVAQVLLEA
ncbi:MAG: holo-ACP synthase [Deltaproteobacteria bacterium]|nr:holo-ACP synthase [Deltaproteobacteria bacterium]